MFDIFIITEEPPDCRLVILDNEVEVDHGQGKHSDHGQLQPELEHHIPGLGHDSRHPDSHRSHRCFVYYPYLLTKIGKLLGTGHDSLSTLNCELKAPHYSQKTKAYRVGTLDKDRSALELNQNGDLTKWKGKDCSLWRFALNSRKNSGDFKKYSANPQASRYIDHRHERIDSLSLS